MAEASTVVINLDGDGDERAGEGDSDEGRASGDAATRDRLWFLGDRPALLKRFVLSEVLGAPRSRSGPRSPRGRR